MSPLLNPPPTCPEHDDIWYEGIAELEAGNLNPNVSEFSL